MGASRRAASGRATRRRAHCRSRRELRPEGWDWCRPFGIVGPVGPGGPPQTLPLGVARRDQAL